MCIMYVTKMIGMRKLALDNWLNWLLRICFALIIQKCLQNDLESIKAERAMFECGLSLKTIDRNPMYMLNYCKSVMREVITLASIIVITWYLFTIDAEGEETVLDQVKDFTALVIIVEIDNMLVGYSDIGLDDLGLEYKNKTLERKF